MTFWNTALRFGLYGCFSIDVPAHFPQSRGCADNRNSTSKVTAQYNQQLLSSRRPILAGPPAGPLDLLHV
jgi:hypothetical protein